MTNLQHLFSCCSSCGSFWSVKDKNFGQKLPIQTGYRTFLEIRYPKDTKSP